LPFPVFYIELYEIKKIGFQVKTALNFIEICQKILYRFLNSRFWSKISLFQHILCLFRLGFESTKWTTSSRPCSSARRCLTPRLRARACAHLQPGSVLDGVLHALENEQLSALFEPLLLHLGPEISLNWRWFYLFFVKFCFFVHWSKRWWKYVSFIIFST